MTIKKYADSAKIISRKLEFDGYHKLENIVVQPRSLSHSGWAPEMSREMYFCKPVVCVLPYIPETDEILLNQQFRIGALMCGAEDPFLYEISAGAIDDGETAEQAAAREVLEETGAEVLALEHIGVCYPSPGALAEEFQIFIGRIQKADSGIYGMAHEGEEIKTHLVTAKQAVRMLDEGQVTNCAAMIALHWFARNKETLRKKWIGGFEI